MSKVNRLTENSPFDYLPSADYLILFDSLSKDSNSRSACKDLTPLTSSVTARLASIGSFKEFKDAATPDPRLIVDVFRETTFSAEQSRMVSTIIRVLGFLVVAVMAVGAVFAALSAMYSTIAARSAEIGTLKAIGFGPANIVASFLAEPLVISVAGGALGCLAALPFNGFTAGTMNWASFSYLAFSFRVRPAIIASGMVFSLLLGMIGGLPPAVRALRLPIITALREL